MHVATLGMEMSAPDMCASQERRHQWRRSFFQLHIDPAVKYLIFL